MTIPPRFKRLFHWYAQRCLRPIAGLHHRSVTATARTFVGRRVSPGLLHLLLGVLTVPTTVVLLALAAVIPTVFGVVLLAAVIII